MVTNLEGEVWKPVKGYEGKYEVSNMGRVKSLNYRNHGGIKILKPTVNHAGYLTVTLTLNYEKHKKRIHRLVYEAFVAPLPLYNPQKNGNLFFEINHIDENKTNNTPSNLELVTHTENIRYGTAIKRKSATQTNGKKSKKVYQYTLNGFLVKSWSSIAECHRNGFLSGSVSSCCRKCFNRAGNNVYKGYIWSFKSPEEGGVNG